MSITRTITALLVLTAGAAAQGLLAAEPTYEDKVNALKAAYRINSNSMDGNGRMVDMTDQDTLNAYAVLRAADKLDAAKAETAGMPLIYPQLADAEPAKPKASIKHRAKRGDICSRHGKRKVSIRGGKSWRCR